MGGGVASGWANSANCGVYDERGVTRSGVVICRGYGVVYVDGNVIDRRCGCMDSIVVIAVVVVVVGGGGK